MKTFAKIAASALLAHRAPPPSQFIDIAVMQVHYRDEGPRDGPARTAAAVKAFPGL